jgi:pimeloyl-ACP methyl ester carboxylesterase
VLLAAGRHGDAVELFMTTVGVPPQVVAGMRQSPSWAGAERIAPTLAYDAAVLDDGSVPIDALPRVSCPTAVLTGGDSPPLFASAAAAVVAGLPDGVHRELPGQTHDVQPEALAGAVGDFVGSRS